MELFDTHSHLADPTFADDLGNVLDRAKLAGVRNMLCVGTTADSSQRSVQIASQESNVFASVGIHPNYAHQATEQDWETILRLVENDRVVALGETGLDRYWDDCPWEIQQTNFHRHWRLSKKTEKPVVVHMRDCESEMLVELRAASQNGPLLGVMHSFAGSWDTAQACLELGLYISFAGMVTYKKSEALRDVASRVPENRLLIETDSPYLSPEPKRSVRPNEPALVVHTAACIAKCRGISLKEVGELTSFNAKRLFNIESFICS
ncbi:MAG: TatD family hydrolase [Pirellulaceae bacterium]|nr:TatD family hydrolase [Pirellulaceae bacterium]